MNQNHHAWHEVKSPAKEGVRFVIANMETQDLALPSVDSAKVSIEQANAIFVVSQRGNEFPPDVVYAHKRGVCTAILRNDVTSARVALLDLVRVLTPESWCGVDYEDFRFVAERSTNASLPAVVAGSGTARGHNAGLSALEIALANAELGQFKSFEKLRGIFIAISGSQRSMKLSFVKAIINEVRARCGDDMVPVMCGTGFDESIGDSLRVTVLAST